jgi:hypothetical protein
MKKLLTLLAALALVVCRLAPAHAGSMVDGGMWGQISFAGNVTVNPTFGYYPSVRGEIGIDRFLFAASLGGVFAGETPDQVVGLDGAFKLKTFGAGDGHLHIWVMGGVSSQQGTYSITVDGTQFKVGPKVFWSFDSNTTHKSGTSIWFGLPFMTSKVITAESLTLENVKYLAFEGGVAFEI